MKLPNGRRSQYVYLRRFASVELNEEVSVECQQVSAREMPGFYDA